MNNMKIRFSILLTFGLIPSIFSQDTISKKLDELVEAYAKLDKFNGAVLVARNGKILLEKGYGIKSAVDKSINTANTKFQIASVTKQFTSTVILKLAEQHKMSLNDKLSLYYDDFPKGDSITIEHLLTHTSGVRNFTEEDSCSISKTP